MNHKWRIDSWKNFKCLQKPSYIDINRLTQIQNTLNNYPQLVSFNEIDNLKKQLIDAGTGKRFILQGGDCAERFIDVNETIITNKIKILLQMSVILAYGTRKGIIRIGRIAGQFSKPRSSDSESINGINIPVYRGDAVNSIEESAVARENDPERLLSAYYHSAVTLNFIRSIISGGFADLHNPYNWNLFSIEKTPAWNDYKKTLDKILDAIDFMESFGGVNSSALGSIDYFISHEGLLLDYEQSMTRQIKDTNLSYNAGSHFLWIGERTNFIGSAHIEYFRGIQNPVGIKIGNASNADEISEIIETLNPLNEPGKIVLIHRFGCGKVNEKLPILIQKIKSRKLNVVWMSDPMHGNIIKLGSGIKTRKFEDIQEEITSSFVVHNSFGTILSGIHFELTGEDVTECIGGSVDITSDDLHINYESYCDPRLNYSQSLEMAFLISDILQRKQ